MNESVFGRFRLIRPRQPIPASDVGEAEAFFGVEFPDSHRSLLTGYGPGTFDEVLAVLASVRVGEVSGFFSGSWMLDPQDPDATLLQDLWRSDGCPLAGTGTGVGRGFLPWGVMNEMVFGWRTEGGRCHEILVLPEPVYIEDARRYDLQFDEFIEAILVEGLDCDWLQVQVTSEHTYAPVSLDDPISVDERRG